MDVLWVLQCDRPVRNLCSSQLATQPLTRCQSPCWCGRLTSAHPAGYVIPRTLVILAIGVLCTRFPAALLVLFGAGLNKKEQLFMASSWVPKVRGPATVSAAAVQAWAERRECCC